MKKFGVLFIRNKNAYNYNLLYRKLKLSFCKYVVFIV